jgi:hypothetical protein
MSKFMNKYWTHHFLSTSTSIFYFKMINNILGYNYVICHFVPDVERNCTFCNISGIPEEDDETPLHLFFSCIISENLINTFFVEEPRLEVSRQEFFAVPQRENDSTNNLIFLLGNLIKKYLWDCKLRLSLPVQEHLKFFVKKELKIMCRISKKVDNYVQGSEACNNFKEEIRQG